MHASTIAAIATPLGCGGIGIIKISGPQAIDIATRIFRKSYTGSVASGTEAAEKKDFISHHLYHGKIFDPSSGAVIDEVLLSVMKAPRSYTREDVVEINSHSGGLLMQRILKLVIEQGAEPARPGEFTFRAFNSGRIDLTQAEAISDLINARSESALKVAAAQLGGELGRLTQTIRANITKALSLVYASMDFGDENQLEDLVHQSAALLEAHVLPALKNLEKQYESRRYLRIGIRVVIAGKPNVGKSTLMNQLVGKKRAIVTAVPGTTRDLIDQQLSIQGIPIILIDTAGLRRSNDPVERIGIQKAEEAANNADLVLAMMDGSTAGTVEDLNLLKMIRKKNQKAILVINKVDKADRRALDTLKKMGRGMSRVCVSALYNQNLDGLKKMIFKIIMGRQDVDSESRVIPNIRQAAAIGRGLNSVKQAIKAANSSGWGETVALELEDALRTLGEITGDTQAEEVLDQVFANFCVGK